MLLDLLQTYKFLLAAAVVVVILIIWLLLRSKKVRSFIPFTSKSSTEIMCDELIEDINNAQKTKK